DQASARRGAAAAGGLRKLAGLLTDAQPVRTAVHGSRPLPGDLVGGAAAIGDARSRLRMDCRDANQGGPAAAADSRGRGRLPPAHRPKQDNRHAIRVDTCRLQDPLDYLPVWDGPPQWSAIAPWRDRRQTGESDRILTVGATAPMSRW